MKKKKASVKFVGRKHSIYGLVSTIVGCVGLITLATLLFVTTRSAGTTSIWIGLIGILVLLFTIFGIVSGVSGFKQKDIFYTFPIIGVVLNSIVFIFLVIIYFLGLSMIAGT